MATSGAGQAKDIQLKWPNWPFQAWSDEFTIRSMAIQVKALMIYNSQSEDQDDLKSP